MTSMSLKQQILQYSRQDKLESLTPWFDGQLDRLIDSGIYSTEEQLKQTGELLVQGLKDYSNQYNIKNVVIGMSGGVDSALTAALFKKAGWNVYGVTMPIHQKQEETDRGIEACTALGIHRTHVDLTNTYEDLLKDVHQYDPTIMDPDQALRRGNLRVRLRMITLYNLAGLRRGLVASTDNFSELAAGFWTLHGDVGDVGPIQSLTKGWEVPKLAELYGVPSSTVFATPTDGLGFSQSDEHQFGFSYLEFDIALLSFINSWSENPNLDYTTLGNVLGNLRPDSVSTQERLQTILNRVRMSTFKRNNPFNLLHPTQNQRYNGLEILDTALWAK